MKEIKRSRLSEAQVAMLFRAVAPAVSFSAFVAVTTAGLVVWLGDTGVARAAVWAVLVALFAACHLVLQAGYLRQTPSIRRGEWGAWFTLLCLAEGLSWGWASVALVGSEHYELQLILMLVCYGNAAGAIPAFGSYPPAFWAMFLPTTVPFLILSVADGRPIAAAAAILATLYVVSMGALGLRYGQELRTILLAGFEKTDLAERLEQEKARAEAANVAKSRFLAAASHDLRQPVHALSLFTAALQRAEMGDKARAIVGHIEGSVAALDELFGALLNISELDADIVANHPQGFRVQALLERLVREYAPEATGKGLGLRLQKTSLGVEADPVLLERVLRNLISNAVRHTGRGRVLVGCRRVGAAVRIEVWDTGPGIPDELRERIFEEFFQHGNPERDRSKGLGLGLAIVRRLVTIMGVPLDLRSVTGRFSCFSVTLPSTARVAALPVPRLPWRMTRNDSQLILVIDDEAAIQLAMRTLLGSWGYDVMAAGSEAEMRSTLAECRQRPALLICDYRLRGGEDGIAVIRRLQEEYNDDLPALLITGDTAPERLIEAKASGLQLLHKPVTEGALRDAMARLTA